jgi:hypothetical protein
MKGLRAAAVTRGMLAVMVHLEHVVLVVVTAAPPATETAEPRRRETPHLQGAREVLKTHGHSVVVRQR